MSVIGLNLWINLQVLKSTHQQLRMNTGIQIRQVTNQIMAIQTEMVSRLLSEIAERDQEIKRLKKRCETTRQLKDLEDDFRTKWHSQERVKIIDMELLNEKLRQVESQNKQYEIEFASLIQQMKTIKMYVEQLKRVKSVRSMEGNIDDSPARLLQNEDQILNKISSLKSFQKLTIAPILDTIREVTQLSARSQEYVEPNCSTQEFQPESTINGNICQIAQSQSFECTNEIQDITNILFDNSSQEIKQMATNRSQRYQTFQHSLSVLKNYCGSPNFSNAKNPDFSIVDLPILNTPVLKLKQIVNERHLIYYDGYIYTGNTVKMSQNDIKPMGFGQLFHHNRLFYCGNWKNGMFGGWGKIFFTQKSSIRSYNGKWQDGVATGPGSIYFWNNDKFLGGVQDGQVRGEGVYYHNGHPLCRGYWQNNRLIQQEA